MVDPCLLRKIIFTTARHVHTTDLELVYKVTTCKQHERKHSQLRQDLSRANSSEDPDDRRHTAGLLVCIVLVTMRTDEVTRRVGD
jgi:hypothetical protein